MVAGAVAVEANLVEGAVEAYLVAESVDTEDKVAKAKVSAAAGNEKDKMKTNVSALTLTFSASQTILT